MYTRDMGYQRKKGRYWRQLMDDFAFLHALKLIKSFIHLISTKTIPVLAVIIQYLFQGFFNVQE